MKKTLIGLIVSLCVLMGVSSTTAYNATSEDEQMIMQLETRLTNLIGFDYHKRWDYMSQLIALEGNFQSNRRISYLLNELTERLHQPLIVAKKKDQTTRESMEEEFYKQHGGTIHSKDFDVPTSCFDHYEFVDTLSWMYDHPTSLTLATWFRESNCRQEGTHNAQGPFQITTNNYGYDEMTKSEFLSAVQDYLQFSNEKYERYNRANGGKLEVEISYDDRTLPGVVYHGALYNGLGGRKIKGEIYPAAPGYVYGNFSEDYASYSRDGVLTMMLKVIDQKKMAN